MTASSERVSKNTSDLDDSIQVTVSIPNHQTSDSIVQFIHDLKASTNAFGMLIEEQESKLSEAAPQRQKTKIRQLRVHVANNRKIIDQICEQLTSHPLRRKNFE
jgi:hypothetical protein